MIIKVACLQKLNNDICRVFFFFKLNLEFLLFFKTSTNVEKEKNEEEGKKI